MIPGRNLRHPIVRDIINSVSVSIDDSVSYPVYISVYNFNPSALIYGSVKGSIYTAEVLFIDDQHGWVVGLNGTVYRTQDGGTNWQQEETGTDAPLYGISLVNDTVIVVGDYGSIIHKNIEDNLDGSWKKLETPLKSRLFFRVVHPLENNKVIIAGAAGSLEIIEIE